VCLDNNTDPRQCTPGTPGICHTSANCTQVTPHVCACNPASSYRCECNQGYTGDGLNCTGEIQLAIAEQWTAHGISYILLPHGVSSVATSKIEVVMACTLGATRLFFLQRLQRVQNCAARYILNAPPRSPSLPLLHQLYIGYRSRVVYATNYAA